MNATHERQPGGKMDETAHYVREPESGPLGPQEEFRMPEPMLRGGHRYSFTSGARPLEGYTIKRAIGRGGFGEVYYSTSDAGKEVALKLLTRNIEIERHGVQHCMNLKSQHLITIFDLKTNEDGDSFVVMEYVSGPSLSQILAEHPNGLPPHEVKRWLKGLVDGVSYLHDHGIVHRDLKPANLFLEDGVVKIGDYGLSKSITHSQDAGMSENVGTCYYMAPEIASGKYHKPIDIYAIGVILYEMLTGKVPFEGESTAEVLMKHLTSMPDMTRVTEPYRSILKRALAKDPANRPGRAYDLLLPEEHTRAPDIRIIAKDGESVARSEGTEPTTRVSPLPRVEAREEVLYIGPEEPVYFIGPDTVPPGGGGRVVRGIKRRFWALTPAIDTRGRSSQPARRQQRQVPAAGATKKRRGWFGGRKPKVAAAVEVPPKPVLPSQRLRVAELASSMMWVAPLAALASVLCFPAYEALGIRLPQDPIQLAFLFLMVLLGTWLVLVPGKWREGRGRVSGGESGGSRLTYLGVGLVLGFLGLGISTWTHLTPAPASLSHGFDREMVAWSAGLGPVERVQAVGFATYFGLTFALLPWHGLTSRGRRSRFRFLPVIKAGAIAGLLGLFWPAPQPWSMLVIVLIALLTQVVSPWSADAARYEAAVTRMNRAA